jgi:WD40 repeat protein
MAQVWRHRRAIAAAASALAALFFGPALAQDQGPKNGTDLYDRPVLAVDPGVHTARLRSLAVDAGGRFAVTGSDDHTVRIWAVADGQLLRTIWIPVGPESVGDVYAVAISPDGSTIAAGGWTENRQCPCPVYIFDRKSGDLVRRITDDLPEVTHFLTFSPDGRYLAATLHGGNGLRIFDRNRNWSEAFRDDQYADDSYGAAFAHDGRLATTSYDGLIRLYTPDANMHGHTEGEFGGLGIRIKLEDGLIKVVNPIEDSPAARAGVLSGDIITAIDDAPTQGLTLNEAVEKMRGPINSSVKLRIVRGAEKEAKELTIVRDAISVQSLFRRVGEPLKAPGGNHPWRVAYSPDGKFLAVGYDEVAVVDVLDATTLERVGGHEPADVNPSPIGFSELAWSRDGQMLLAAGSVQDAQGRLPLFAWDRGGLGDEKRMTYCSPNTAGGIETLPDGRILVAAMTPCLDLINADGQPVWTVGSRVFDFRDQDLKASVDASLVDFAFKDPTSARASPTDPKLRFDLRSLTLSSPTPNDGLTFAPPPEGPAILVAIRALTPIFHKAMQLWGIARPITIGVDDIVRSVAIPPDAKRSFFGSSLALTAFDDAGKRIWRWQSRNEIWAVNASRDGRIVVTADGDGAIHWHRADDGRELLTLQVLPNGNEPAKWDWVLWTPEGFYEATPGAENVLKWVVNHGPNKAATTLPVSAIAKLHRGNALPHVLDQLETAHALGVDDMSQARLDVQAATGSAKPPGGVLHVLAIGVDKFGDKAGGLHLNYAAEDAHDVATALLESQKARPGKASLYADVSMTYLPNDKASKTAIEDALDDMVQSMATNQPGQDVAVILVSSHGEVIDGQFYLVPYDFIANGSKNAATSSAVSANEFAKKVQALAEHGKVLVLLDTCHSGAVGAQGWATDPDAKVLQDAMDLENVTVLTSSKQNELSEELPEWKHGALAEAFLDALTGAADPQGIVKLSALTDAMGDEVESLTKGRQHLGMHMNFRGDLFVASHY